MINLCFVIVIELLQMIKINKFKKQTDRLLVVSEKKLYKVDAAKIKVIKRITMFMMFMMLMLPRSR